MLPSFGICGFAKLVKNKFLVRKWKINIGDKVEVIAGDDCGKQGIVYETDIKRNVLKVRGCKLRKIVDTQGQERLTEKYIHYSNVNLVDPVLKKSTRIAVKYVQGQMLRVSKLSGAVIPIPDNNDKYLDFSKVIPGPKDTSPEIALKKTYSYESDVANLKLIKSQMKKYNHDLH